MILGLVVLIAFAIRLAVHGSIGGLESIRIRGEAFLLGVFVLVFALPLVSTLLHPSRSLVVPVWVALMVVLLGLCLFNGRQSRGFLVMAAGVALNLLVIALNGGMPVSEAAVLTVGGAAGARAVVAGDLFHSVMTGATKLAFLSDVLPLPGFRGLRGVFSIGDVLMFVGIVAVLSSCESRPSSGHMSAAR